jgi:uncharacterized protein YfaA (DUF2138 family)
VVVVEDQCVRSGWSVAIAHTNPASSRAQATTIFWWLAAPGHPHPAAMQALLATPRALEHGGVLVAMAMRELATDRRSPAAVRGRLDQQPPCVAGAGLGDRALAAPLTRGALRGDQADEAQELLGRLETREVADLADQAQRGERVDAPHAAQPRDQLAMRSVASEAIELCLKRPDATID